MSATTSSDPRFNAALVVERVCDQGDSVDLAIEQQITDIQPKDQGLFKEICFGSVRWANAYDERLMRLLHKPLKKKDRCLQALLISAMYQLDFMREPEYAVVNQTVAAVTTLNRQWARGLVNGILRAYIRGNHDRPTPETALPEWLRQRFNSAWGTDAPVLIEASMQRPPLALRVNCLKIARDDYLQQLAAAGIEALATPQSQVGVELLNPVSVVHIPGFVDGLVSVQDESAQLAAFASGASGSLRVLDGCAAPGGKTGHLLELAPDAEVVALDKAERLPRLHENLARLGLKATVVAGDLTERDSWWDGTPFDCILLDVPCSGTGVIRRHPDILHRRLTSDIAQFATQQFDLLSAAWVMLKAGGRLLYTTCSVLPEENAELVQGFLAKEPTARLIPLSQDLGVDTGFGRQRLTGVHSGDGFFYALLEQHNTE